MHVSKRTKLNSGSGVASTTAAANATQTFASVTPQNIVHPATTAAAPPAQKFLSHLLLLSTAQLASHAAFTVCRRSTLAALGEVASRYIESIGVAASTAATVAGRSEVNLHDILYGLSEMGVEFSEMRQWKEMTQHEEVPFAHSVPPFPQVQEVVLLEHPPLQPNSIAPRPNHIPPILPAFPPRRTYAYTPDMKTPEMDVVASRKRKVEENRKLESALVTLHQAATKAALEMAIEAEKELRMPPAQERPTAAQPTRNVIMSSLKPSTAGSLPAAASLPVRVAAPTQPSASATPSTAPSPSPPQSASPSPPPQPPQATSLPATLQIDAAGPAPMDVDEAPVVKLEAPAAAPQPANDGDVQKAPAAVAATADPSDGAVTIVPAATSNEAVPMDGAASTAATSTNDEAAAPTTTTTAAPTAP